jgi:glucose repression regulatory protein TUP1
LCHVFAGHTNEIYALDYAQNGNFIVSGSADRTARLWDLRGNNTNNGVFKCEATIQECGITSISILPTCRFIAGGCLDGFIRIWNIATGEVVAKLRGHSDSVYAIKFTADGKSLVSGSLDYTVKYWDTTNLLPHDAHFTSPISCPLIGNMKGHQVRVQIWMMMYWYLCDLFLNKRTMFLPSPVRPIIDGWFLAPKIVRWYYGTLSKE